MMGAAAWLPAGGAEDVALAMVRKEAQPSQLWRGSKRGVGVQGFGGEKECGSD